MKMHRIVLVLPVLVLADAAAAEIAAQKAALVTGAGSGSGRVIAESLAARGCYVYAGARKQADIDAPNDIDNIEAVRLDVTVQSAIDAPWRGRRDRETLTPVTLRQIPKRHPTL